MRVFLDTNVVLDFLTGREPFADAAEAVVEYCTWDGNAGGITTLSACNIVYVLAKALGRTEAEAKLGQLLELLELIGVSPESVRRGLQAPHTDFEDEVQLSEALAWRAEAVVTRDVRGFKASPIPVFRPSEFVERFL